MSKARPKAQKGRPSTKGERQTVQITFRLTPSLKMMAEHFAKAEGRPLANFLANLIRDRCREGLGRATPYQAAEGLRKIGADNVA
jgi:hypothetical protein